MRVNPNTNAGSVALGGTIVAAAVYAFGPAPFAEKEVAVVAATLLGASAHIAVSTLGKRLASGEFSRLLCMFVAALTAGVLGGLTAQTLNADASTIGLAVGALVGAVGGAEGLLRATKQLEDAVTIRQVTVQGSEIVLDADGLEEGDEIRINGNMVEPKSHIRDKVTLDKPADATGELTVSVARDVASATAKSA